MSNTSPPRSGWRSGAGVELDALGEPLLVVNTWITGYGVDPGIQHVRDIGQGRVAAGDRAHEVVRNIIGRLDTDLIHVWKGDRRQPPQRSIAVSKSVGVYHRIQQRSRFEKHVRVGLRLQ